MLQAMTHTERYRSGHNEAVLKTVCLRGHKGSNPFLSANLAIQQNIVIFGEVLKLAEEAPLLRV